MATITKTDLAHAVREASGMTSNPNAVSLLDRVAALRAGGEDDARILARLNGPAITSPLDEHPTPSRGDGGLHRLASQQRTVERAQRVSVDAVADAIAARVVAQLTAKREVLDELDATPIPDPPADLCATPAGDDVTDSPWQRACDPPADPRRGIRATGRAVLDMLRPLPVTGLRPGRTVMELADELGIEYAACTGRVTNLYRSGHLERTRLSGAFVYRLAVTWGE